jgi:hypothetical protein
MAHQSINNFTAGELTPHLDARTDLAKYGNGASTMENMRPLPWGGVTFRPGTIYKGETKYSATRKARLLDFNFSTDQTFIIEVGHLYMRFFDGSTGSQVQFPIGTAPAWTGPATAYVIGDRVTSGGLSYIALTNHNSGATFAADLANGEWEYAPYEIATDYDEEHLFELQFKQLNDVVYFSHPSYWPQKLSRVANDNWTIEDTPFLPPPMLDENITAITMTCSNAAVGTGRTLTASSAYFDADMVGGYFQLNHRRDASATTLVLTGTGNTTVSGYGPWSLNTRGTWAGTVEISTSDDNGTTYTVIRKYVWNTTTSASNILDSGDLGSVGVLIKIAFTHASSTAGANMEFRLADTVVRGLVKVTGYTNTTTATVDVVTTLLSTSATKYWAEGAWSTYRGFPRAVGLREQRLCFSGTASRPNWVWESCTGDFENFQTGPDADDALAYQLAASQQNPTQWLETLDNLHIGTSGNEMASGSGSSGDPITPTNINARPTSFQGSDYLQPVVIDRKILFIERQGRRLREKGETFIYANPDSVALPDLTIMAEHILRSGVVQMGFSRLPDPLLYCVRADGQIAVLTYNREQQIQAWARFVTDGIFESVACIYNKPQDQVWCIVNRTVEGAPRRFIERFFSYFDPTEPSGEFLAGPLTFKLPSLGTIGSGFCDCPTSAITSVVLGGDPTKTYNITLRVAGVAESNEYTGGTAGNGWYVGGTSASGTNNIYKITYPHPDTGATTTLYLNPGSIAALVQVWDYIETLRVRGGSEITLSALSQDDTERENTADLTVPNITGINQPYQGAGGLGGQFMQVQFMSGTDAAAYPVDYASIFFLDCGVSVSNTTPSTSVTGLDHLEGRTVGVVADGEYIGTDVVSGGALTLDEAATIVNVGLLYTGTVETMKMDTNLQDGTSQGRKKRISGMAARFRDTIGGVFDVSGVATTEPVPDSDSLFTGERHLAWPGNNEDNVTVKVQQTQPLPMTLIGLFAELKHMG